MGNRAKKNHNKCHHRTNLIALLLSDFQKDNGVLRNLKFCVQRVPPIQISSQNGKIQVLFNKLPRIIKLMAFLDTKLGSRNKKTNSEF
jgi:hypothetical protein